MYVDKETWGVSRAREDPAHCAAHEYRYALPSMAQLTLGSHCTHSAEESSPVYNSTQPQAKAVSGLLPLLGPYPDFVAVKIMVFVGLGKKVNRTEKTKTFTGSDDQYSLRPGLNTHPRLILNSQSSCLYRQVLR